MRDYKPKFLKTDQDVVIGEVIDYTSSPDGDKTILYINTNDGEKVSVDPYDTSLAQNLKFLRLEAPADLIGGTWRFSKRAHNGKWYFDIKAASPEDQIPDQAPPPRSPAPAPASAPPVQAAMSIDEAARKYDDAIQALIVNTVPRIEDKLMGALSEGPLVEFLHGAAATILIASTPRQSSFPPKTGGGGGGGRAGFGSKPAWKK